ncbi:hypothetical protein [Deinococcus rufus]|uniref:Uncharacterized protein n=1 Tax=Deinococcus rufus TaxID=2136097 RepID=A0ABV7ZBD5_9DEIO
MRTVLEAVQISFPPAWSQARTNHLPVTLRVHGSSQEVLIAPELERTLVRAMAGAVEHGWTVDVTLDRRLAMIVAVSVRAGHPLHPTTLVAAARGRVGAGRFDAVLAGQGETWPGLCRQLAFRKAYCNDLSEHAFEARTGRGLRVYVTDGNAALPRDEENYGVEVVSAAGDTLLTVVVRQDVLIVDRVAA